MLSPSNWRAYDTPFKRHLSFWDLNNDGFIYFGETLRGNLALGLDFPVAFIGAIGIQTMYGNTHPFFFGPFNGIEIARVPRSSERNMLESIDASRLPGKGLDRTTFIQMSRANGLVDWMHVYGLWALAANRQSGLIGPSDVRSFQKGTMLYDLEKRRKDRSDVLPLTRGGPISVAGHSWFVGKLFGVEVYRTENDGKSN